MTEAPPRVIFYRSKCVKNWWHAQKLFFKKANHAAQVPLFMYDLHSDGIQAAVDENHTMGK
jgi:hypothetical protein